MAWSDVLTDIDWGGVAKATIPAAIGTYIAGNANQRAAQQITDSNARASQLMASGAQAGQKRYDEIASRTAPAVSYLQSVMADQGLTPGQKQRVIDTRRQTGQMLSNKVGGRSATAIATRAAQDLENSIYNTNRARSDNAAGILAGQNLAAMNASAGQDINLGVNQGNLASRTGETIAGSELATGQLQGRMIGDVFSPIRSIIAEERKGSRDNWQPIGG